VTITEIKQGSIVRYRKAGMSHVQTGRVEHAFIDAYTHQPYWRVRPDTINGKRVEIHQEDIDRAEKPIRRRHRGPRT